MMENFPRTSAIGQLFMECMSDTKSRYWEMGNQSVPRDEVICPEPHRASKVPYVTDSPNKFSSKRMGILLGHPGEHRLNLLDIIIPSEDDTADGGYLDASCQMGFFCGSPPVRTNNPVVHDEHFAKQTLSLASALGKNCSAVKQPPARVGRGSPACGASSSSFGVNPKERVEGFACGGSPESPPHCVMPSLA